VIRAARATDLWPAAAAALDVAAPIAYTCTCTREWRSGSAIASQAMGRGFESRLPLQPSRTQARCGLGFVLRSSRRQLTYLPPLVPHQSPLWITRMNRLGSRPASPPRWCLAPIAAPPPACAPLISWGHSLASKPASSRAIGPTNSSTCHDPRHPAGTRNRVLATGPTSHCFPLPPSPARARRTPPAPAAPCGTRRTCGARSSPGRGTW
jgi:hypothetical protein